jgi:hypothetical protein
MTGRSFDSGSWTKARRGGDETSWSLCFAMRTAPDNQKRRPRVDAVDAPQCFYRQWGEKALIGTLEENLEPFSNGGRMFDAGMALTVHTAAI